MEAVRSGSFVTAVPAAAGIGSVMAGGFPIGQRDVATRVATPLPHQERSFGAGPTSDGDRRIVREPSRQAFGRARTESHGRPAGWILLMSAVEKVFFPTTLLIMLILGHWEGLALTVACETAICVTALAGVMKGRRLEYALKGLAVTPIRYALLGSELVTIGRFAADLWITNNRKWRK